MDTYIHWNGSVPRCDGVNLCLRFLKNVPRNAVCHLREREGGGREEGGGGGSEEEGGETGQ